MGFCGDYEYELSSSLKNLRVPILKTRIPRFDPLLNSVWILLPSTKHIIRSLPMNFRVRDFELCFTTSFLRYDGFLTMKPEKSMALSKLVLNKDSTCNSSNRMFPRFGIAIAEISQSLRSKQNVLAFVEICRCAA